jgi:hypothetical protein
MSLRAGILAACLCLACCAKPLPSTPVSLTDANEAAIQNGVRSSLKDPESARIRALAASQTSDGVIHVCGMVNARNSFGGYVGDQPFIGQLAGPTFVVTNMASPAYDFSMPMVLGQCRRVGLNPM